MYCDRCLKEKEVKQVNMAHLTVSLCKGCFDNEMKFRNEYPTCGLAIEDWNRITEGMKK